MMNAFFLLFRLKSPRAFLLGAKLPCPGLPPLRTARFGLGPLRPGQPVHSFSFEPCRLRCHRLGGKLGWALGAPSGLQTRGAAVHRGIGRSLGQTARSFLGLSRKRRAFGLAGAGRGGSLGCLSDRLRHSNRRRVSGAGAFGHDSRYRSQGSPGFGQRAARGGRKDCRLPRTALAGLFYARIGPVWLFAFDALTFAVVALVVRTLPPTFGPSAECKRSSLWADAWEGVRFALGRFSLVVVLLLAMLTSMFWRTVEIVMVPVSIEVVGMGPEGLGFLYTSLTLGEIASTAVLGGLAREVPGLSLVVLFNAVLGLPMLLAALFPSPPLLLGAFFVSGELFSVASALLQSFFANFGAEKSLGPGFRSGQRRAGPRRASRSLGGPPGEVGGASWGLGWGCDFNLGWRRDAFGFSSVETAIGCC